MVGDREVEVGVEFLVDVHQRRRHTDAAPNREAQTVRLAWSVVRVLAENHHLHLGVRSAVERGEHVVGGRVDGMIAAFLGDELLQFVPVGNSN